MKVVLATNNPGKLKEMQTLFAELPLTLHSQADFDIPSVAETGTTFIENALLKAKHVAAATGLAAIADDSGLVVPILNGEPGIYSARYAQRKSSDNAEKNSADADNNQALISELTERHTFDHPVLAYFYCAMVLLRHAEDPIPLLASAAWQGQIIATPRGENGFGYDPYFLVDGLAATSAELSAADKNQLSHRAQASQQLLAALRQDPSFL